MQPSLEALHFMQYVLATRAGQQPPQIADVYHQSRDPLIVKAAFHSQGLPTPDYAALNREIAKLCEDNAVIQKAGMHMLIADFIRAV